MNINAGTLEKNAKKMKEEDIRDDEAYIKSLPQRPKSISSPIICGEDIDCDLLLAKALKDEARNKKAKVEFEKCRI